MIAETVWLTADNVEPCRPEVVGNFSAIANRQIHAEIEVFGLTHISMGGHGGGPDHNHLDALCPKQACDPFRGFKQAGLRCHCDHPVVNVGGVRRAAP